MTGVGGQYLLTFENTETHQTLSLGGIQVSDVDAMGRDLGSEMDMTGVSIHMHGESPMHHYC